MSRDGCHCLEVDGIKHLDLSILYTTDRQTERQIDRQTDNTERQTQTHKPTHLCLRKYLTEFSSYYSN